MQPLKIHMHAATRAKIMHWVKQAGEFEVSGFANVVRRDYGFEIVHPVLIEQDNTHGTTVMDGHSIGKAMYELENVRGEFNYWWHSHGHGDAYFSNTDLNTIASLGGNGWLVATVFNTQGHSHSAFFANEPYKLFIEGIEIETHWPVAQETKDLWSQEYRRKVKNFEYHQGKKGKKGKLIHIPHQTPQVPIEAPHV